MVPSPSRECSACRRLKYSSSLGNSDSLLHLPKAAMLKVNYHVWDFVPVWKWGEKFSDLGGYGVTKKAGPEGILKVPSIGIPLCRKEQDFHLYSRTDTWSPCSFTYLTKEKNHPKVDWASCVRSQKSLDPKSGLYDCTAHISSTSALYCSCTGGRMAPEIEKDLLEAN